jgi:hypothetical protein
MTPVAPFFASLNALWSWLLFRREVRSQHQERLRDALVALHHAADETRAYLADQRARQLVSVSHRNRARERELSHPWTEAGGCLVHLGDDGRDLDRRCFDKGRVLGRPLLVGRH